MLRRLNDDPFFAHPKTSRTNGARPSCPGEVSVSTHGRKEKSIRLPGNDHDVPLELTLARSIWRLR